MLDGGDGFGVAQRQDALPHARRLVDVRSLVLHGAHEVAVRVQQRLQGLRLLGQDAAEAERLLRFREPLQEHLHGRSEFLRLTGDRKRTKVTPLSLFFFEYVRKVAVCRTCLKACCRRLCFVTDRAHTVSQRLLSS